MQSSLSPLPKACTHVRANGKDIYLVGTAHVSRESVEDVSTSIKTIRPDAVCVELCEARYRSMTNRDNWRSMDIFKVIKEKKTLFVLAQLMLASFYRKISEKLGVQPGAEMMEGVRQAGLVGADLVCADRNVEITLKRVWGYLGFFSKVKMLWQLVAGIFVSEDIDETTIEEIKQQDQMEGLMASLASSLPEVKKRLIDERDVYLSQKIRSAPGDTVVAVVGAGHVPGILEHIHEEHDLAPLEELPPQGHAKTIIKWVIPALILLVLILGFFKGGAEHSMQSVYIWFLVNGTLSAAGTALALANPLTILATFLAAPLTSMNPLIAAGWVAGLVQAWVKKPTVADLEDIPRAIGSVKGFWKNPVCRILLVVVLANVGSSLGTFIAGSWITARIF
ncbi:TraB/GumN family protein [Desulfoplanes formicivorans]|uniref:Conjugal transfer protein TraB n=1 Tax=Desulfoplanes formicivorans TaxID=1592317 RepID=A0A194AG84_9BACT|nr:TraB/GumN family protein [Desulfoplanes formicivorans]GAU08096.1 conjugal transfer protein TraB [Desulfoplanes formicivorans]